MATAGLLAGSETVRKFHCQREGRGVPHQELVQAMEKACSSEWSIGGDCDKLENLNKLVQKECDSGRLVGVYF